MIASFSRTARGCRPRAGFRQRQQIEDEIHWTDIWYYGVAPLALYAALACVARAFRNGADWAPYGVAAVIVGLLLISVRDEYDLVTWLAPRGDAPR